MSDWIDETVKDFGRLMGLAIENTPVSIEFEKRGVLSLERRTDQLLIILSRPMTPAGRLNQLKKALQLCYFKRQPAFNIQAALHGAGNLAFIARLQGENVTVAYLDRVVSQLTRMHNQLS